MTNASTSTLPAQTHSSLRAVCSRKDLFEGVQTVGHAVSGRSSLPILSHLLLQAEADTMRLSATDLELSISLTIPAYIEEPGGLTAPARILTELLGTLPEGDVMISGDSSHAMHLRCGRSNYKLLGLPAEEYPRLPEVKEENQFRVAQSLLREMIRQTLFAVSTDEARAILTGILMVFEGESLQLVSTDTHRLALRSTRVRDGLGTRQAIVPKRAMNELLRVLTDAEGDVEVRLSENQVLFKTPTGITLVSRLIEGQFPNYQRVIPTSYQRRLTIEVKPFLDAVRRASIVGRNNANRVTLNTEGDKLMITAESGTEGNAYEELEVAREGEDIRIAFNAKYLMDVLDAIDSEGVYLELTEPLKPSVIRPVPPSEEPDGNEYLCVLMPMQLA